VIERLERQESGDPADVLYATFAALEPVDAAAAFARTDLDRTAAAAAFDGLIAAGRLVRLGDESGSLVYTRETFDALSRRAVEAVDAYLKDHPLRRGPAKEELRSRLGLSQRLFAAALDRWSADGRLVDAGRSVSLAGWQPKPTEAQERAAAAYVDTLRGAGFAPPSEGRPDDELVAYLVESGKVVEAGGIVFAAEAYEQMVEAVLAHLRAKGTITVADTRDLFGTSRRYVLALLDDLDAERITLRRGDERVLGPRAPRPA
jgi:selenocysteine-specific elongation factor